MDGGPSFASRRPAATALPAFSLPPPDISRVANGGLSPLSSGVNTGSSMSSQHSTATGQSGGAYYGHMSGSWPGPGGYTFNGPSNTHNQVTSPLLQQPFPSTRSWNPPQHVSPPIPHYGHSSARQHMTSPPLPDSLPRPQSYDQSSPVFLTPISGHGSGGSGASQGNSQMMSSHSQGQVQEQSTTAGGGPPDYRSAQHQHQQQSQIQQQHQQEHQRQQSQAHYGSYTPSSTPQQANFPTFQSNSTQQPLPSPTDRTPTSANSSSMNAASRAVASMSQQQGGPLSSMAPPMSYNNGRQPLSMGYQPMSGQILTNLHQPGNPLSMMGSVSHSLPGYQGGPPHHAHLHMYTSQHSQQNHTDRPYKCDQCHQSFSRNHDLKRHKKIHLAVKPFPCDACEKSFSRKDALKRHRMVKGCGEGLGNINGRRASIDKSDVLSESTEGSPTIKKDSAERM